MMCRLDRFLVTLSSNGSLIDMWLDIYCVISVHHALRVL